jgi:EAL domain-containing protein (putative c-di-GMP-specific phosphodiesterase class I)/GGDEF domain-containing protein
MRRLTPAARRSIRDAALSSGEFHVNARLASRRHADAVIAVITFNRDSVDATVSMASTDPFSQLRGPAKAAFFEPYARLVQVLYARARGVIFYDARGKMIWQKDADVEGTLSGQVRALVQEAADPDKGRRNGSERLLKDSTPSYLLWLRDDRDEPLGILGVTCKPPPGRTPAATIAEVEKSLQPLLQCIARELATLRKVPGETQQDQSASRLQDFEWLADKALPLINSASSAEPLRELLAAILSRTDSALGAVVVPDSSIRVIVESPGWSSETAKDALRRAHRQVLSWVQLERRTFLSSRTFKQESDRDSDDDSFAGLIAEPEPEPKPAKDAGSLSYHVIATPILQQPDRPIGYVALLRSPFATEFGDKEQQLLERLSPLMPALIERDYDSLTNLRSAAGLERALRSFPTTESSGASVIFFDLVGLGAYNRDRGAAEADRLIRDVAKLLRPPQLPEGTICARLGGGHFACLLSRQHAENAEDIARRVREASGKQNQSKRSTDTRPELCSGIAAVAPTAAGLRHALITARAAAQPAQPARAPGRDSPKLPEVDFAEIVPESSRMLIPVRLREALRDNRLKLYAQPMRPVRDPKRAVRLELLPRIVDEGGTLIPPAEFLSTGSDRDALLELDRWVMSTALSALAARGPQARARTIELALNISARSLEVADFHDWVAEQLRREVLPAEQWLFEIAETTAANHGRDVARFAKRMLRAGARIVIDNVGGAACGRLQAHGASSIKMDGALLRDVVKDVRAQRLVEALAQWASASRMDTVAAQVESEQVRDWLTQLGVDYIQGYAVSKPQPLEEVLDELLGANVTSNALVG